MIPNNICIYKHAMQLKFLHKLVPNQAFKILIISWLHPASSINPKTPHGIISWSVLDLRFLSRFALYPLVYQLH